MAALWGIGKRTACPAPAYGAVRWVVEIASNVANLGVNKALVGEVAAIKMLGAPEATGSNGAALGALGNN